MPWVYNSDLDAFSTYHLVQEEHSHEEDTSLLPSLGHAIAGASGTAISNVLIYPLSLVITRLQVQARAPPTSEKSASGSSKPKYNGVQDAVAKIYKTEGGLSAFYAGVGQDTAKSIVDSFIFFLAYNSFKRTHRNSPRLQSRSPFLDDIAIGMLAGALTKGLTSPISQVVTRKQTTSAKAGEADPSAQEVIREIVRTQGLQGLWSGYSAQLLLTLNPSLTFFFDAFLQKLLRAGDKPSGFLTFLVAATSKAAASAVMYPVQLAKTQAQAAAAAGGDGKKKSRGGPGGVLLAIPKLAQEKGIAALYAGLPGEVIKGFLQHGITMVLKQKIHVFVIMFYFKLIDLVKTRRLDVRVKA